MTTPSEDDVFLMWVGQRGDRVRRNEDAFRRHSRGRGRIKQDVGEVDEAVPAVCEHEAIDRPLPPLPDDGRTGE